MWRSFFFAVGITLIFIGLQSLTVEEFRIDKNSRIFAIANRANRALDGPDRRLGFQPGIYSPQNPQGAQAFANQQRFSLPSAESYYGGPSRFTNSSYSNSSYSTNPSAYGGGQSQFAQQSRSAIPVSSTNFGFGNNVNGVRPKLLQSYRVKEWMPWCFLAAGTIITLYTKSTGHRYSGE